MNRLGKILGAVTPVALATALLLPTGVQASLIGAASVTCEVELNFSTNAPATQFVDVCTQNEAAVVADSMAFPNTPANPEFAANADNLDVGLTFNVEDQSIIIQDVGAFGIGGDDFLTFAGLIWQDNPGRITDAALFTSGIDINDLDVTVDSDSAVTLDFINDVDFSGENAIIIGLTVVHDPVTAPPPPTRNSEPATLALAGLGLVGIFAARRRRRS